MSTPFDAAIAELERQIEEADRKTNELRDTVNSLCAAAGLPPRYPESALRGSANAKIAQIRDDTFYGKKQTPAMREYLEMRKAQGLGPAKPKEIYDALKSGGYQFDAKNEVVALVSMRALLRTQQQIFHKLPQGTWGLTVWYPDAKRQRDEQATPPRAKRRRGRPPKNPVRRGRPPKTKETEKAAEPESEQAHLKVVDPAPSEPSKKPKAA